MRANKKNKNLVNNLICLIVFIFVVIIGIFVARYYEKNKGNDTSSGESYSQYFEYDGKKYIQNDDLTLILFAGLDSYDNNITDSYRNSNLSDCLVLLVLDNENKTIQPIQINRDTMCNYHVLGIGGQIVGDEYGQIALAHSYGSGDLVSLVNTKNAVSSLLCNINIDYYVSLPMDAVPVVNDLAGGIDVLVEDDFSGIDSSIIQGQVNTLRGKQSLTFVRARSGMDDSSNIARMNRQKVYLRALYDKCKVLVNKDSDFMSKTFENLSEYVISNTNVYGLSDLANTLLNYELLDSISLKGEARVGNEFVEYYVDDDYINSFCLKQLFSEIK